METEAPSHSPGLKLGETPPRVPISLEGAIAAAIMAALALITLANVLARWFSNVSIAFTEEYSVTLMVILTLVGSAAAFAADRHIRLTFFTEKLPKRVARLLEQLVLLSALFVFGAIAWLGAFYVWDEYRFEVLSPGLGVPQWLFTVWLPVLAMLICLRILGRMRRVARARG